MDDGSLPRIECVSPKTLGNRMTAERGGKPQKPPMALRVLCTFWGPLFGAHFLGPDPLSATNPKTKA
jgi:hypothetical protein